MVVEALSDQDVRELIRIAEGGLKERRGYWYTLGIKINHYFSLDEQLEAIQKLGLSKNITALDYLRKLNVQETRENGYQDAPDDNWASPCYDELYPNAKGLLQEVLESRIRQHREALGGIGLYNNSPRMHDTRSVISQALSKLEESLK